MSVSDFDIYLNGDKIKRKQLDMEAVRKKTVESLMKLNGIALALTANEIQNENFEDSIRSKVKAGFNTCCSGDVIYVLKPNWLLGFPKGTTHGSPYSYDVHVPLLWWGYEVKAGSSNDAVSITQIAPTVCTLLKIPPPAGCISAPVVIGGKASK